MKRALSNVMHERGEVDMGTLSCALRQICVLRPVLTKLEIGTVMAVESGRKTSKINLDEDETGKAPGSVQGMKALVVRR